MVWARLDDQYPDHPKVTGLSDAAFRLHVSAIAYSSRYLTDGFLPEAQVKKLLPHTESPRGVLAELIGTGLLDACDGGYLVHDYLDYNPAKSEVEAKRGRDRRRKRSERAVSEDSAGSPDGLRAESERIPSAPSPIPIPNTGVGDASASAGACDVTEITEAERYAAICVREVRGAANVAVVEIVAHLRECIQNRGSPIPESQLRFEMQRFRDHWQAKRSNQPANAKWSRWKRALSSWLERVGAREEPGPADLGLEMYPNWDDEEVRNRANGIEPTDGAPRNRSRAGGPRLVPDRS